MATITFNNAILLGDKVEFDSEEVIRRAEARMQASMDLLTEEEFNPYRELGNYTALYKLANVPEEQAAKKMGEECLTRGWLEGAQTLFKKAEHNEGLYQVGMEHTRRGDTEKAFEIFEDTQLSDVTTEDDLFYETIANSVLSLYLTRPESDPQKVKDLFNRTVKSVIKELEVEAEPLQVSVNFGRYEYVFRRDRLGENTRNDVATFTKTRKDHTVLKGYDCKDRQQVEKFWLQFLEEHFVAKRWISSEEFNGRYFNTIEKSFGTPFYELNGKAKDYTKRAIDVAKVLVDLIKEHETEVRQAYKEMGLSLELKPEYLEQKFSRLYEMLRSDDSELAKQVLVELPKKQEEVMHTLLEERSAIVPWDYTPRNVIVEEVVIPIDHEDYKEAHPIMPVVTFLNNPGLPQIQIEGPQDYIQATTILYNARRAQSKGADTTWHLKRIAEVME